MRGANCGHIELTCCCGLQEEFPRRNEHEITIFWLTLFSLYDTRLE